ncbi:Ankyrin repeat and death domain-containing protein 1A [Nymphon striatum]|nr:Ankyrin repeat and death domain-containing protein 1A [Nymphon striatum]
MDVMGCLRRMRTGPINTFGELCKNFIEMASGLCRGSYRAGFVFDTYVEGSIKDCERARRSTCRLIDLNTINSETKLPVSMDAFWASPSNKTKLQQLLRETLLLNSTCKSSVASAMGVAPDILLCVSIYMDEINPLPELDVEIEEADVRLIPHALHAANHGSTRIVILSNDTDVMVLALHYWDIFKHHGLKELWMRAGVGKTTRYVPLHILAERLGRKTCITLIANGMRPLHLAAWFGHKDAFQIFIESGANFYAANKKGDTVLHCVAQNNKLEILEFILDSLEGVKINSKNKSKQTPLHVAVKAGHFHFVNRLIQAKCDVNNCDIQVLPEFDSPETLSVTYAVVTSSDTNSSRATLRSDCTFKGSSHSKVYSEVLTSLEHGRTALHVASEHGHSKILERLLRVGVEIDDRDEEGQTALHAAAAKSQIESMELLLKHNCDPNAENSKEMSALHLAVSKGHLQASLLLLEYGALIEAQDKVGSTPLHIAADNNFAHIVRSLIDHGANINATNKRLQTPLHLAAERGFSEVCEMLMMLGALLDVPEKGGKSALYIAARGSYTAIVDMLIKAERNNAEKQVKGDEEQGRNGTLNHETITNKKLPEENEQVNSVNNCNAKSETNQNHMNQILWSLAYKQLKAHDWKKLAVYWKFTDAQIKAIEHQYTGKSSYREHGYRLLLIWLNNVPNNQNPVKVLYEALVATDNKIIAEAVSETDDRNVEREELCRKSLMKSGDLDFQFEKFDVDIIRLAYYAFSAMTRALSADKIIELK